MTRTSSPRIRRPTERALAASPVKNRQEPKAKQKCTVQTKLATTKQKIQKGKGKARPPEDTPMDVDVAFDKVDAAEAEALEEMEVTEEVVDGEEEKDDVDDADLVS